MNREVLEQRSPARDTVRPRGGTSLVFVRSSSTGAVVSGTSYSVSAVGAPTELEQIARDIVQDFGDALDRLAE